MNKNLPVIGRLVYYKDYRNSSSFVNKGVLIKFESEKRVYDFFVDLDKIHSYLGIGVKTDLTLLLGQKYYLEIKEGKVVNISMNSERLEDIKIKFERDDAVINLRKGRKLRLDRMEEDARRARGLELGVKYLSKGIDKEYDQVVTLRRRSLECS
jgi:hypothetical protein